MSLCLIVLLTCGPCGSINLFGLVCVTPQVSVVQAGCSLQIRQPSCAEKIQWIASNCLHKVAERGKVILSSWSNISFLEVLPSRLAHAHLHHFPCRDCSLRIVLVHHMFQAPASAAFRCCFCYCFPLVVLRQWECAGRCWKTAMICTTKIESQHLSTRKTWISEICKAQFFWSCGLANLVIPIVWLHGARKTFVCPGAGCSGEPCLEKHHWGLRCSPQQETQPGWQSSQSPQWLTRNGWALYVL